MTQQYDSHAVDWTTVEQSLVQEFTTGFREIAIEYPDAEFYCLCFECDLVYTGVQAHANTNEDLRKSAKKYLQKSGKSGAVTIEQQMEQLRWDVGSWGYFQLLTTPDVAEIAAAFQQLVQKVDGYKAEMLMKGDLLDMACRSIVRLEQAGVFEALRRTPDFRVMCIYREPAIESDEETAQRLSRIRKSMAGT